MRCMAGTWWLVYSTLYNTLYTIWMVYTVQLTLVEQDLKQVPVGGGLQYTLVGGGVQQVHGGLCTLYSSRGEDYIRYLVDGVQYTLVGGGTQYFPGGWCMVQPGGKFALFEWIRWTVEFDLNRVLL